MLSIDSARTITSAYGNLSVPTRPSDTGAKSGVTVPFSITTDPSLDPTAIAGPSSTPVKRHHHGGHHHAAAPADAPAASDPTDPMDPANLMQSANEDMLQSLLQQTHTKLRSDAASLFA